MKHTSFQLVSEAISRNLPNAFLSTETLVPDYQGKVRDVFTNKSELFIVTTDRVSVFDQVIGTIPLKGALLTKQSSFWLQKASDLIKTHFISLEDAQIQRCKKAKPFRFEVVVRGYLAGSLAREAADKRGSAYGLTVDPAIKEFDPFESPLLTPTTKADKGNHDEAISLEKIVSSGLASQKQLDCIVDAALGLFELGSSFAREQGLILVDTKYEFGLLGDEVILIDEIHTADSSRYWILPTYEKRLSRGLAPEMLDKERLRRILIERGADPKGSTALPPLSDELRSDLAIHYWQLTETLTGGPFLPPIEPACTRVEKCLRSLKGL